MSRNTYIIKGKTDENLTTAGLWFALSYLYSVNIDSSEDSYTKCGEQDVRIGAIQNSSKEQVLSWIYYAINFLERDADNSGNLSLEKQKQFANELSYLRNIEVE